MLRYIKIKRRFDYVPFSRANIYARDDHECQYCGGVAETLDHVIPRSKGGAHTWENVVAACRRCDELARKLAALEQQLEARSAIREAAIVEFLLHIMKILDPPPPRAGVRYRRTG